MLRSALAVTLIWGLNGTSASGLELSATCHRLLNVEAAKGRDSSLTVEQIVHAFTELYQVAALYYPEQLNEDYFRELLQRGTIDEAALLQVPAGFAGLTRRSLIQIKPALAQLLKLTQNSAFRLEAFAGIKNALRSLIHEREMVRHGQKAGRSSADRSFPDDFVVKVPDAVQVAKIHFPDRLMVASRQARIFDPFGKQINVMTAKDELPIVTELLVTSDGKRIITEHNTKQVKIWDHDGNLVTDFGTSGEHHKIVLSPDEKTLWTGGESRTFLWNTDGGSLGVLESREDTRFAAFSPDGQKIVLGSGKGWLRIYTTNGELLREIPLPEKLSALDFSPTGDSVVVGLSNYDGRPRVGQVWDLDGNKRAELVGHRENIRSAVFSADGSRILTTAFEATACVWETDGTLLATIGSLSKVRVAIFHSTRDEIVTGDEDGSVRFWRPDGSLIRQILDELGIVTSIWMSKDGKYLVTGTSQGWVRVRRMPD
jgi:WD40 repeat protein